VGIGDRIGRSWKIAALLGVGAAGGAAAVAVATVPDSSGVIHACVKVTTTVGTTVPQPDVPNVRIIDTAAGQQCTTTLPAGGPPPETALNWNVTGPQGPPGQNGQPGTQGPPGANGKTATVTAGNTFTIGGTVITVGQSRGLTLAPPTFAGNGFGTLTLTAGSPITADITGMSFGPHSLGTGQGGGKTTFHDISVTKHLDKASAKLQLACASGKHFKEGVITLRKAGGKQIEYDMHDVFVATYSAGSAKNSQPTEDLTLDFAKVDIHFKK
jgi:hypothetical protein